jgi:hypothetical protein
LYARPGIGGSYWTTYFAAVIVLGFGMAVTVAPLTTTVMGAVEAEHAGVASGVNNAVARVAGLLAIAVFSVVLAWRFDARIRPRLDGIMMPAEARRALEQELPKMAGARVDAVPSLAPEKRALVQQAVDEAFVSAFRLIMLSAAALALAAAGIGSLLPAGRAG